MMKVESDIKLDFSDVLIRPKRSTLESRSEINLEREFKFPHSTQIWKGVPIIASNMDTVGTVSMYQSLKEKNMLTCFHKFLNIDEYPENERNNYIISIGIRTEDYLKLSEIYKYTPEKCNIVCIDIANGYIQKLVEFCQRVRKLIPHCILIAGNVVTREMVEELIINGKVDIVKVGIGSGSVCTTRLQTGVGMPQLSCILECADAAHGCGGHIISDGGITCPGDASKAFGAGADFVMLGSMLSGHEQSGGELIEEDGKLYKVFYGMSSDTAMNKHYGGVSKYRSSEGKTVKVEYKGPVENTILDLLGGIRSTCTYVNAKNLKDLSKCTTFMRVNNQVNKIYG
uniref:GMP reductase n=1 Tax=viral metagenome TaxID=1070528 RepID=A0A6C0BUH6_9ZZZZ